MRVFQAAPLLIVGVIGLAIQCPPQLIDYCSLICVLLFGLGVGGILTWCVTRFYASIMSVSDLTQLGFIGASVVLSSIAMACFQESNPLQDTISRVGPVLSVSVFALFANAVWGFVYYDAPRQLANEPLILE